MQSQKVPVKAGERARASKRGVATLDDLARRWASAKDEVARLKRERNACRCEIEDPGDSSPEATVNGRYPGEPPTAPCWKATRIDPVTLEDVPAIDPADWCPPCLIRQAIHERIGPARRELTSATRALLRAARKVGA